MHFKVKPQRCCFHGKVKRNEPRYQEEYYWSRQVWLIFGEKKKESVRVKIFFTAVCGQSAAACYLLSSAVSNMQASNSEGSVS